MFGEVVDHGGKNIVLPVFQKYNHYSAGNEAPRNASIRCLVSLFSISEHSLNTRLPGGAGEARGAAKHTHADSQGRVTPVLREGGKV